MKTILRQLVAELYLLPFFIVEASQGIFVYAFISQMPEQDTEVDYKHFPALTSKALLT
jgi:hypothetical protein